TGRVRLLAGRAALTAWRPVRLAPGARTTLTLPLTRAGRRAAARRRLAATAVAELAGAGARTTARLPLRLRR
ncbi:MAG TPA: hypothetical protein VM204_05585, partial [Gaiellaceae bacterium]|nr:hypothetical protein [Gaiellaceae bacterium]